MGLKKLLKKAVKIGTKVATGDLLGAAATTIGALAGGKAGSKGATQAADASVGGHNASALEQRAALGRVNDIQDPYYSAGVPAVNALMRTNSGDYSDFEKSPDYLYARDEALGAVENSAAARGGLFSGNTGRRLMEVGSGLASQNLENFRNSLFRQINVGQTGANALTGATLNTAGGVGADLSAAGDARASGIAGKTNAKTGMIEDLAGVAGDYLGNKLIKKKKPVGAATTASVKLAPRTIGPYA
jgi:hypothetical protein